MEKPNDFEFAFNIEMEHTTQTFKARFVTDTGKSEDQKITIKINGQADTDKLQAGIDKKIILHAQKIFIQDSLEKMNNIKITRILNAQRFIKTISVYVYDSTGVRQEYLIRFKDALSVANNNFIELIIKADCTKGQMLFTDEELSINNNGILVITPKNSGKGTNKK